MSDCNCQIAYTNQLRGWGLRSIAIVVLVFVAYWIYGTVRPFWQSRPTAATVTDIRNTVSSNTQAREYKAGGENLNALAKAKSRSKILSDSIKMEDIRLRVGVDFLRTLTPEQIKATARGLPFNQLDPNQRKILKHLPVDDEKVKHMENSYIKLKAWSRMPDPYLQMYWCAKDSGGREACYFVNLYYTRNAEENICVTREPFKSKK